MYENVNFKDTDGIKTKGSGEYIQAAKLTEELLKSQAQGAPTDAFTKMVILLATNLSKKMKYVTEDDRQDCIQFAIMDCLTYYKGFDINKGSNAFAYLTSMCSNGFAKGWRKLGYHEFPSSIMTRLDGGNIHSL